MAYPDFTTDTYEDFEDSTLASGLSEVDVGGNITFPDAGQVFAGSGAMKVVASTSEDDYIERASIGQNYYQFGFAFYATNLDNYDPGLEILNLVSNSYGTMVRLSWKSPDVDPLIRVRIADTEYDFPLTPDQWYWLSGNWIRNGTGKFRIYNYDHTEAIEPQDCACLDYAVDACRMGNLGSNNTKTFYFDRFVDYHANTQDSLLGWESAAAGLSIPVAIHHMQEQGML